MDREIIKFRAKRIDNLEWVYGDLIENQGRYFVYHATSETTIRDNGDWKIVVEACGVFAHTIGQYTGLKDRNGKEIYEGDLLGSKGKVIGWVKGGVRGYCYDVVYINHPAGESDWSLYSTFKDDYPEQIEVIGNIHDNPELLKGGRK